MRVLVAAGGSGGHIFPALSVLEELRAQNLLSAAGWVGTPGGLEEKVLAPRPWIAFFPLPSRGLPRDRPWAWPASLAQELRAARRAREILRLFRPQVVLAMGGYPAVAPGLAAKALGIPLAVHEQNAQMGWANRLLSHFADVVLLSFPATAGCPKKGRTWVTGTPVRTSIAALSEPLGTELLVLGGSLGARGLLEDVVQAAPALAPIPNLRMRLVVGRAWHPKKIERELKTRGVEAAAVTFTEDMAGLLRKARLVLSRAGASTLAELACAGRPALLVPWEGAADGHQLRNAQCLARQGAAVLLREKELADQLAPTVAGLWNDEAALARMAKAARALARPEAARAVGQFLLALAERKEL